MVRNLALVLVSTLLSVCAAEVVARLELLPLPAHVPSDAWWEERWHRERRGLNPRAFVTLDPELGYIPAPNLRDVPYEGVRISTNSAHMRGRTEYRLERTGAPRVAAVGDSYVFGQCAEEDESIPAVLAEALPGTEVLNFGVMGYGQDQALLRMRRDALPYRPDAVVFGFHPTDMSRNLIGFRGWAKPRFELVRGREGDRLELVGLPLPAPEDYDRLWPPRLWNYVRMHRDGQVTKKERRRASQALSRAIVSQMAAEAKEAGAPLFVVYLPHPGSIDAPGPYGWKFMAELCADARARDFTCVNPMSRIREIAPTAALQAQHFACHFSPEIYRAVALETADALADAMPERWP